MRVALIAALASNACAGSDREDVATSSNPLERRAYIVAQGSDELTVIDLDRLEIIGRVKTFGEVNHMAELTADFRKVYVSSPGTNEVIVVDAERLEVERRLKLGDHPTHMSVSPDGDLLGVVNEKEGAVSFVDTDSDEEIKRVPGFFIPHFVRWAGDGKDAYVANLGAHQVTRVDLKSFEIADQITLDGDQGSAGAVDQGEEVGYADAQIDRDGIMYAADRSSGRVLVYDTVRQRKMTDLTVGNQPWIVFADHPFTELARRYLGPNFGDKTVSMIDGNVRSVVATLPGDSEAYGVNYSSLTPNKAFVMNRVRKDIAVVDTREGAIKRRIEVGGNTETAATTPDGKLIVATVSGADKVVVIDALSEKIIKTFEKVGKYPWSVTIPGGQNYCH